LLRVLFVATSLSITLVAVEPGTAMAPGLAAREAPERVSVSAIDAQGRRDSYAAAVSASGRYVAFTSINARLVPRDTNKESDAFLRDTRSGTTIRISVNQAGRQLPQGGSVGGTSPGGRYIVVNASRRGFNHVFLYDRALERSQEIDAVGAFFGTAGAAATGVSADGNLVVSMNEADDFSMSVFVYNRAKDKQTQVSRTNRRRDIGDAFSSNISADGRFVPFTSVFRGEVYVRDRYEHRTVLISRRLDGGQGRGFRFEPFISANGRYVAFSSWARGLVRGDRNGERDVFVRDRVEHRTFLVSVSSSGRQGNGESSEPTISARGRFVVFTSTADNLVRGDRNGKPDVFIHDLHTGRTRCVSVGFDGRPSGARSFGGYIGVGGRAVGFTTRSRLEPSDTNRSLDAYLTRFGR
jgi:Tol biopolymer transport system component